MSSPRRLKSPARNESSAPASATALPPAGLRPTAPARPRRAPWALTGRLLQPRQQHGRGAPHMLLHPLPDPGHLLLPAAPCESGKRLAPCRDRRAPRLGVLGVSAPPSAAAGGGDHTCELCWEAPDLAGGGKGSLVTPRLIHKVGLEGEQGPAGAVQSPAVAVPGVCGMSSPRVGAPGKSTRRGCAPAGGGTPSASQPYRWRRGRGPS